MSYTAAGRTRHLVVGGGWVEVTGDRVRVLATTAEDADEIDEARAEAALKRATERLSRPDLGVDSARALNAMRRAQARLEVKKRLRGGK